MKMEGSQAYGTTSPNLEVRVPNIIGGSFLDSKSLTFIDVINPISVIKIVDTLVVLYGIVATVALVQPARIQLRVPEYGWTTQKVFHFLKFLVNGVRCVVFIFYRNVQRLKPEIVQHILLDVSSLAFFTTYALVVLFWDEIYYQESLRKWCICFYMARAVSTAID